MIVCCLTSNSRIFHLSRESLFPMTDCAKIRPKTNINHLIFKYTLAIITCIYDSLNLKKNYQTPNHNSVTCTQPNNSFMVSHTYVPGYTLYFVMHIVYKKYVVFKHEARIQLNNIFPFDLFFKRKYFLPKSISEFLIQNPRTFIFLTRGSGRLRSLSSWCCCFDPEYVPMQT